MKLLFAKSAWEIYGDPIEAIVERIVEGGYDVAEVYLHARPEGAKRVGQVVRQAGIPLIAQVATLGDTPQEHILTLQTDYLQALEADPLFINCHTGSDWFERDDNLRIFEAAETLAARHGVPIRHETHRGRAFFSLPQTVSLLRALPQLRITADFSHWFCVHEENLEKRGELLALPIARARHIHARVGFSQGPQVGDPRNPAYQGWLDRSLALWRDVLHQARRAGEKTFTLTPESGPPEYMPLMGASPQPVADAWEVNAWMHRFLREKLSLDAPLRSTPHDPLAA